MGFEESALKRLVRYREEADLSGLSAWTEEGRPGGSPIASSPGWPEHAVLRAASGFEIETPTRGDVLDLRVVAGPGAGAGVTFGVVGGAAAETDEDLMHEELSRYSLDPSGYSGRILGWSEEADGGALPDLRRVR